MPTFHAFSRRFEQLKTEADKVIHQAMDNSLNALTDENRKQLMEGYNKKGKVVPKYKLPRYAKMKARMNPVPGYGTPDLKLTGDWQAGMETIREGEVLNTESSDYKNKWLEKRYDPFGLGGKFKQEFLDDSLEPNFQTEIEKIIQIPFKK